MKKSLYPFAAISVLFAMLASSLLNTNLGYSLIMSHDMVHNIARVVLIVAFVVLAFTVRPRATGIRVALACVSALVTGVALYMAATYTLPLLDALVYLASATVLMIEAIEGEALPVADGNLTLSNTAS